MARPSTVEQLPPDILEQLQALLRDPRVSQMDATVRINAILAEQGHPERVSKSAVNRYSRRMEQVGERLRQSRAVAEMWIGKLGATPQGQLGHLVNEILRTLAFDMSMQLQDDAVVAASIEDRAGVISMLKELSLSVVRLEKAASENVKREEEIRRQERAKAAEELAEKVKGDAKGGAITLKRLNDIIRESYGV
ncbi:MAG: DUF3486 family protein [Porticoccaceae bacterium]|nr:DUF3486 family protein [Porticoccaceae bacterium]